jgi:hypothetical protein
MYATIDGCAALIKPPVATITPTAIRWTARSGLKNEIGLQKKASPDQSHEARIGHYLSSGFQVAPAFRRIAEILNLAQTTRDWTLVPLAMMPVFEQYLEEFMRSVSAQNSTFKNFVAKQSEKKRMIFVSDKIEWISVALKALGWDPASADSFISELRAANKERVQVVHYNKQSTFQESTRICAAIMNNVILLETALGREVAYAAPLKRLP